MGGPTYPRRRMPTHHVYPARQRPDVGVLVKGVWCEVELRKWTQSPRTARGGASSKRLPARNRDATSTRLRLIAFDWLEAPAPPPSAHVRQLEPSALADPRVGQLARSCKLAHARRRDPKHDRDRWAGQPHVGVAWWPNPPTLTLGASPFGKSLNAGLGPRLDRLSLKGRHATRGPVRRLIRPPRTAV